MGRVGEHAAGAPFVGRERVVRGGVEGSGEKRVDCIGVVVKPVSFGGVYGVGRHGEGGWVCKECCYN